jgi:hypothetical protein
VLRVELPPDRFQRTVVIAKHFLADRTEVAQGLIGRFGCLHALSDIVHSRSVFVLR